MPHTFSVSYEEAIEEAESYLSSMGIKLELYFSEPCTVLNYGMAKSDGWKFVFTKRVWDLQSQFEDGQWSYANPEKLPAVGAPWDMGQSGVTDWQSEQIIFSAIDGSYVEPRIDDKTLKELHR